MCEQCEGLAERFQLESPGRYRSLAGQLYDMVKRGSLRIVEESAPLDEIASSTKWAGDTLYNKFECTRCGERFQLFADTYHGRAEWSGALNT